MRGGAAAGVRSARGDTDCDMGRRLAALTSWWLTSARSPRYEKTQWRKKKWSVQFLNNKFIYYI